MKAAVLQQYGAIPQYADVRQPEPENDQQVRISMRAAAIKQLDLAKAAGTHYIGYATLPAVVGVDGVGMLADGRRVYAMGLTGMIAQQALVAHNRWTPIPDGLDDALAAALPNALLGSDAALRHRAKLVKGETVLVNGASGSTGTTAVQVAKYHGAATVIATGRNPETLEKLKQLGADETVLLAQDDQAVIDQLKAVYARTPIDLVVDYLWGHPMELILSAIKTTTNHQRTRIVAIGEMADTTINLESGLLRSRDIEFIGSGIGSLSMQTLVEYMQHTMPEMLQLAAAGKLFIETETMPLSDVAQAWQQAARSSKRMVITI